MIAAVAAAAAAAEGVSVNDVAEAAQEAVLCWASPAGLNIGAAVCKTIAAASYSSG
jgi:hypothetical protein